MRDVGDRGDGIVGQVEVLQMNILMKLLNALDTVGRQTQPSQ